MHDAERGETLKRRAFTFFFPAAAAMAASPLPGTTRVDGEIPSPVPNGVTQQFNLAHAPNPPASLLLYRNGVLQEQAKPGAGTPFDEYSLGGASISTIGPTWLKGDRLRAYYWY